LHLKSDGEAIKIPVMLYSAESFMTMMSNGQLFFGMFYGILVIAAIIYFFFFFASFFQNNSNDKHQFGGLGLGLYIVKTLVNMQNGTIEMNSTVNQGTTCIIELDFDVVIQEKKEVIGIEPVVCDLGGKTILVVEDNPINQMVVKMITKKWLNTTVIYANNGQEALEAFKTNQFDMVLMNLQMPVMDGYEATIAIRNGEAGAENVNIPIIAITADVMETTNQRVKDIGMNHYLSKPTRKETLYETVKKLV
jgi:CheY-like chemotaxis protein